MPRPYRPCPNFRAWRATNSAHKPTHDAMPSHGHVRQETRPERKQRLREEAEERNAQHTKDVAARLKKPNGWSTWAYKARITQP